MSTHSAIGTFNKTIGTSFGVTSNKIVAVHLSTAEVQSYMSMKTTN